MSRRPIVGGNWKCNPAEIAKLDELVKNINDCDTAGCDTALFGVRDRFAWTAADDAIALRIFVDPVAIEAFAQQGRVASTARHGGAPVALTLTVASPVAGASADARVFALDSIYSPPRS